jgi:prepilin-type N-terminal cleavage/methylation domain-containing protein
MNKNKGGFSLVELMIVIGIIGILSAMSFNGYNAYRRSIALNHLKSIAKQLENLRMAKGKTLYELTGHTCPRCDCDDGDWYTQACRDKAEEAFKKVGFKSAPINPWGVPYSYESGERAPVVCNCTTIGTYIPGYKEFAFINLPIFDPDECTGKTGINGTACDMKLNIVKGVGYDIKWGY